MKAFSALLSEVDEQDRPRRQLHVGLLSSQLVTLHCRKELAKRGGPLPRTAPLEHFASQASASVH